MKFLIPVLILFIFTTCKKEEKEIISNSPEIVFENVSPTTVKAFKDSIVFTISYTDGDGDLGENDPDAKNIFITDPRINSTYSLRMSQLAPSATSISIKGKVSVTLHNTIITNDSEEQSVVYSIYVKDRAGNISNTVSASAISVVE